MTSTSLAQRLLRTVGESPVAEGVAHAQATLYGPLTEWVRRGPLHTDVLGHSVHPMLTDVTLGCWLSATILDVLGGPASRRSATVLVATGLAVSGPTAMAGAADWTELTGTDRTIGAVHGVSTDLAVFRFLGSLVARLRGRPSTGSKLAAGGNLVMVGAGFLGGHLALARGTARRAPAPVISS